MPKVDLSMKDSPVLAGVKAAGRVLYIAAAPLLVLFLMDVRSQLESGLFSPERFRMNLIILGVSILIAVLSGADKFKHEDYKARGIDKKGLIPF